MLSYEGKENAIPITLDVLANQTNSAVKLPVYYSFSLSRVSFVQVTATPDPLISPSTVSLQIDLIDNNDYGYCEACGVEIGIKRLEARPTATLCIDCKTLDEIKEKQEHG